MRKWNLRETCSKRRYDRYAPTSCQVPGTMLIYDVRQDYVTTRCARHVEGHRAIRLSARDRALIVEYVATRQALGRSLGEARKHRRGVLEGMIDRSVTIEALNVLLADARMHLSCEEDDEINKLQARVEDLRAYFVGLFDAPE